jgi:hypothetical protein
VLRKIRAQRLAQRQQRRLRRAVRPDERQINFAKAVATLTITPSRCAIIPARPRASHATRRNSSPRSLPARREIHRQRITKPATPALLIENVDRPSCASSRRRIARHIQLHRRHSLGLQALSIFTLARPANHFARTRIDKRVTSARPSPRLAPVTTLVCLQSACAPTFAASCRAACERVDTRPAPTTPQTTISSMLVNDCR